VTCWSDWRSLPTSCAARLRYSNKARLRTATEEAQRRGVFGAPTFFVGEEMFWGNDRLEDALACAHAKAATP
jgi:2-hydroxychromene-2-carboxylate isomerase